MRHVVQWYSIHHHCRGPGSGSSHGRWVLESEHFGGFSLDFKMLSCFNEAAENLTELIISLLLCWTSFKAFICSFASFPCTFPYCILSHTSNIIKSLLWIHKNNKFLARAMITSWTTSCNVISLQVLCSARQRVIAN